MRVQVLERIGELRGQIDEIDRELFDLLRRRLDVALEIGALKRGEGVAILDRAREAEIVARAPVSVRALYAAVVVECRKTVERWAAGGRSSG